MERLRIAQLREGNVPSEHQTLLESDNMIRSLMIAAFAVAFAMAVILPKVAEAAQPTQEVTVASSSPDLTCSYQLEFEKELEFQTIVIPSGTHKVTVETPIWMVVQYNSDSSKLLVNGQKGVKGHLGPYFVYSDFPVTNYPDSVYSDKRTLASFWPVNNEKIDSSLYPIVAKVSYC